MSPAQPQIHRPVPVRVVAQAILKDFTVGRLELVGEAIDGAQLLHRADRGLLRESVLGSIRYQRLYDALADAFLRGSSQPLPLRLTLRLGAHQLFGCDRIPPHAAVSESVRLLRRQPNLQRVANAVLRKLAALRLPAARPAVGPERWLPETVLPRDPGRRYSLPDELITALRPVVAADPARDWADLNRVPHCCTVGAVSEEQEGILRRDGDRSWWADPKQAIEGPVAAGAAMVQDPSQARALELAEPRAGERFVDCCAAPGGKSRQAQALGLRVVAADRRLSKVRRLPAGGRLVQDARRPAIAPGSADLVLVDAPCSNTGVCARRPEARWRYSAKSLRSLVALQRDLLAAAADLVAPDGRLLYATCSLDPAENEAVAAALAGWQITRQELHWPSDWQGGGYAAVLRRR